MRSFSIIAITPFPSISIPVPMSMSMMPMTVTMMRSVVLFVSSTPMTLLACIPCDVRSPCTIASHTVSSMSVALSAWIGLASPGSHACSVAFSTFGEKVHSWNVDAVGVVPVGSVPSIEVFEVVGDVVVHVRIKPLVIETLVTIETLIIKSLISIEALVSIESLIIKPLSSIKPLIPIKALVIESLITIESPIPVESLATIKPLIAIEPLVIKPLIGSLIGPTVSPTKPSPETHNQQYNKQQYHQSELIITIMLLMNLIDECIQCHSFRKAMVKIGQQTLYPTLII